ncbi:MEIS2: Homeobox protein Meis2 [Crotalus adamanteus]|uniref:MEIS2: Homeobox protein Meis2 n=1 Tax=Crotalus adamanteus TaxID=8729 RepID=A0AAW1C7A0_CROAD
MGMSMTQSSYTPSQMTPHPTQLEHGPQSIHICQVTPSPSHDDAWRIPYPSWNDHFSTEPPTMLTSIEPNVGGQLMDIHAQIV